MGRSYLPNCHREIHYGANEAEKIKHLQQYLGEQEGGMHVKIIAT